LKNETVIESPRDVSGVLGMCSVLIRDEGVNGGSSMRDGAGGGGNGSIDGGGGRRGYQQAQPYDAEEMAEEQGWVARMVHLFRSDDLDVQFQVCKHFPSHLVHLKRCLADISRPFGL
jgi:vacuolar protein sorting-associated protein 35